MIVISLKGKECEHSKGMPSDTKFSSSLLFVALEHQVIYICVCVCVHVYSICASSMCIVCETTVIHMSGWLFSTQDYKSASGAFLRTKVMTQMKGLVPVSRPLSLDQIISPKLSYFIINEIK